MGEQEDWLGAVVACKRAIAIDPRDAHAWKYLGNYLRLLGDNAASIAACKKAINISPQDHEAWQILSVALQDGGRLKDSDEAKRKAHLYELENKRLELDSGRKGFGAL
nr:tetratricopeptide repeat protein [Candidatus Sigynarchaeum springense]